MGTVEELERNHFLTVRYISTAQIVEQIAVRPLRRNIVQDIKASFILNGVTKASNVMVMLLPRPRARGEEQYKLLEGAHRIQALRELHKEGVKGKWNELEVRVYKPMSEELQLLFADGTYVTIFLLTISANNQEKTETLQERTMFDAMQLYHRLAVGALKRFPRVYKGYKKHGPPEDPTFFAIKTAELTNFITNTTRLKLPKSTTFSNTIRYLNFLTKPAYETLLQAVHRLGWDFTTDQMFRIMVAGLPKKPDVWEIGTAVDLIVDWYHSRHGPSGDRIHVQDLQVMMKGVHAQFNRYCNSNICHIFDLCRYWQELRC